MLPEACYLLLEAHKNIRGSGVTLDPEGGNVWPRWMDNDPRFFPLVGDVVDMAREEVDLPKLLRLPADFNGFDFVIVGITIHQGHLLGIGDEGILGHANELKDRLHFAQLYFAFKYLKPGGMVLMRHHMSVRLVDYHFLALMLSLFKPERAITNVLQRQKNHRLTLLLLNAEDLSPPSEQLNPWPSLRSERRIGLSIRDLIARAANTACLVFCRSCSMQSHSRDLTL